MQIRKSMKTDSKAEFLRGKEYLTRRWDWGDIIYMLIIYHLEKKNMPHFNRFKMEHDFSKG